MSIFKILFILLQIKLIKIQVCAFLFPIAKVIDWFIGLSGFQRIKGEVDLRFLEQFQMKSASWHKIKQSAKTSGIRPAASDSHRL